MSEETEKSTAKKSKIKIKSDKHNNPIAINDETAEKLARKALREKKLTKKAAPTPKEEFVLRWYHFASVAVVLVLVIVACVTLFRRYDPSLINSDRMLTRFVWLYGGGAYATVSLFWRGRWRYV